MRGFWAFALGTGCLLLGLGVCSSMARPGSDMVISGTVVSDGTVSELEGWPIIVYEYLRPPSQLQHVVPIGRELTRTACDPNGRYEVRLNVQELMSRNISRVVVYASPNPVSGTGWRILDLLEGAFTVDLAASQLPPLPGGNEAYQQLLRAHEALLGDYKDLLEETRHLEEMNVLLRTITAILLVASLGELVGLIYFVRSRR
jgi:hypothetical protein